MGSGDVDTVTVDFASWKREAERIAAMEKLIAELEAKLERIRAEACLCRQDVARDRGAALDRIVDLAKPD